MIKMIRMIKKPAKKVAFISSYSPRKCGIATFTSDLINNVKLAANNQLDPVVIAMESEPELKYDKPVKLKIRKNVKQDYIAAADYINYSDVDVVSIQHEFGLFGGQGGSYLNLLLKNLKKPVITTLHTVLRRPSLHYFNSLIDVCEVSEKIIVMNKRGVSMLSNIYYVPKEKITLIPHGIPDLPFADSSPYKKELGISNRKTILTFGLLSKNKGIEIMLKALPRIIQTDPSVLYIILGVTHPEVLRHEGQSYKLALERMIKNLGLEKNVIFHNRFVEDKELYLFLNATDIYVTPYLNKEQLTSGTLAFAVGAGKAVISTPYWAAQELLAHGRGKLVRFGNSEHITRSIVEILKNTSLLSKMQKRAYDYGRSMTWPKIGQKYWQLLKKPTSPASMLLSSISNLPDRKITPYNWHKIHQSA